nr:hypothetical protein HK105_002119 [Polyrhizophydium stewartii]
MPHVERLIGMVCRHHKIQVKPKQEPVRADTPQTAAPPADLALAASPRPSLGEGAFKPAVAPLAPLFARPSLLEPLAPLAPVLDLNKVDDSALSAAKQAMSSVFSKNQIKRGDAAYQYDVKASKDFGPPVEKSDWDSDSDSDSDSGSEHKAQYPASPSAPQSKDQATKDQPPIKEPLPKHDDISESVDEDDFEDDIDAVLDALDFGDEKKPAARTSVGGADPMVAASSAKPGVTAKAEPISEPKSAAESKPSVEPKPFPESKPSPEPKLEPDAKQAAEPVKEPELASFAASKLGNLPPLGSKLGGLPALQPLHSRGGFSPSDPDPMPVAAKPDPVAPPSKPEEDLEVSEISDFEGDVAIESGDDDDDFFKMPVRKLDNPADIPPRAPEAAQPPAAASLAAAKPDAAPSAGLSALPPDPAPTAAAASSPAAAASDTKPEPIASAKPLAPAKKPEFDDDDNFSAGHTDPDYDGDDFEEDAEIVFSDDGLSFDGDSTGKSKDGGKSGNDDQDDDMF